MSRDKKKNERTWTRSDIRNLMIDPHLAAHQNLFFYLFCFHPSPLLPFPSRPSNSFPLLFQAVITGYISQANKNSMNTSTWELPSHRSISTFEGIVCILRVRSRLANTETDLTRK